MNTSTQDKFQRALAKSGGFFYPESGLWSDGTQCRFGVQDAASETAAGTRKLNTDPLEASLRILSVHPDDPSPEIGTSVRLPGGQLVLGAWTDTSSVSGTRTGLCRMVDARAYPVVAVDKAGKPVRLLIIARTGAPITAGPGAQDVRVDLGVSHTAHTPPGVLLQVGEQLVTSEGDRYTVLPPVQRDVLGDTLGLSYQSREAAPTIPAEGADPTPPPANPADSEDPYWEEGP